MSRNIGHYEIVRELGQGGMGTVYLAHDPRLDREVAIKVLKPQLYMDDPDFSARFEREAKIVASLTHSAIVPIYDYNDDGEWRFFVMPYMSGGSLRNRVEKGPIPLEKALPILRRVTVGLDKAHSNGIVHRDLKPGNILFDEDNEAFLCDFGIMKLADPTGARTVQLTQTGLALGTPHYMSPEQLDGAGDLDGRSDIYALGIILYEMLTGKKPYDHDSMARVIAMHYSYPIPDILETKPDLPPGIADVIRTAMAKNRGDRFDSAGALYSAVKEATNGEGMIERKPVAKPKPETYAKRQDVVNEKKPVSIPNGVQKGRNEKRVAQLQYLKSEAERLISFKNFGDAHILIDKMLEMDPTSQSARALKNQAIRGEKISSGKGKLTWSIIIGWLVISVIGYVVSGVFLNLFDANAAEFPLWFGVMGFISSIVEWLFLRSHTKQSHYWIIIKTAIFSFGSSAIYNYELVGWLLIILFLIVGYIWIYRFPME